jgi:predicted nucleotidyltransferase
MVVIDEKERVPPLDEAALERLGHALDREGVIAAMLIGSQARRTPGPLSDVDIAVWHEPGLDPAGQLRLQLELARLACGTLRTNEVDIVLLNGAPPLLRHRAIRDAKLLIERDPVARVRLNARALLDYLDTEPLRDEMSRGLRKRIREGRLVDPKSIDARLEHLSVLLAESERIRASGRAAYDASFRDRLAAQHAIQLARSRSVSPRSWSRGFRRPPGCAMSWCMSIWTSTTPGCGMPSGTLTIYANLPPPSSGSRTERFVSRSSQPARR